MFFNSLDWTYYQNGPPGGVKSLLRSTDPNLDVLRCEFLNLGQKTVPKALKEGGAAGQDDVGEENLAQVHI